MNPKQTLTALLSGVLAASSVYADEPEKKGEPKVGGSAEVLVGSYQETSNPTGDVRGTLDIKLNIPLGYGLALMNNPAASYGVSMFRNLDNL